RKTQSKTVSASFQRHQVCGQIMDIGIQVLRQQVEVRLKAVVQFDAWRFARSLERSIGSVPLAQRHVEIVIVYDGPCVRFARRKRDRYGNRGPRLRRIYEV